MQPPHAASTSVRLFHGMGQHKQTASMRSSRKAGRSFRVLRWLWHFPWLLCLVCGSALATEAVRPNILVILADDLGYGDLGCYNPNSKIPTPHFDRLAAGGMRFTNAHTPSSVCTPTRYGLLTGRYCWRTWLKKGVLDGFDPPLIEPGRSTIASFLKAQGYTTACIGKWHLGMTWTDTQGQPVPRRDEGQGHRGEVNADFARDTVGGPLDCGFDSWFGISGSLDMPPYVYFEDRRATAIPYRVAPEEKTLLLNQSRGPIAKGFVLEDVLGQLTRRAVDYIASRAGRQEPFFLYLPLTSPHLPVVPAQPWQGKSGIGPYGDFVLETDSRLGEIMDALQKAGLQRNTLVLVTSDNGGLWHEWAPVESDDLKAYRPTPRAQANSAHGHHSNAHLRGTKADIWEGGHRVPLIVHWPAGVKSGQISDALVELNDTFATLADILGAPLGPGDAPDSISFRSVLEGGAPQRDFALHHSMAGVFSLREGAWKFVPQRGSGGFSTPRFVKPGSDEPATQLYHLENDPSETLNLAAREIARVQGMAARLRSIQEGQRTRPP